jgi:hypothetical protein
MGGSGLGRALYGNAIEGTLKADRRLTEWIPLNGMSTSFAAPMKALAGILPSSVGIQTVTPEFGGRSEGRVKMEG